MTKVTQAMTVVEQATKALNKATADATKIYANISILSEAAPALVEEIQILQGNLNALTEEYSEKFRKAKAELSLKLIENEQQVLENLMKKFNLATITHLELEHLREDLLDAKHYIEATVGKAVAIAKNQEKAAHEKTLLESQSNWKVEKAELVAKEQAAQHNIEMLTQQLQALQETITAERTARIEIAQAESNRQGVTVNTNGK